MLWTHRRMSLLVEFASWAVLGGVHFVKRFILTTQCYFFICCSCRKWKQLKLPKPTKKYKKQENVYSSFDGQNSCVQERSRLNINNINFILFQTICLKFDVAQTVDSYTGYYNYYLNYQISCTIERHGCGFQCWTANQCYIRTNTTMSPLFLFIRIYIYIIQNTKQEMCALLVYSSWWHSINWDFTVHTN